MVSTDVHPACVPPFFDYFEDIEVAQSEWLLLFLANDVVLDVNGLRLFLRIARIVALFILYRRLVDQNLFFVLRLLFVLVAQT